MGKRKDYGRRERKIYIEIQRRRGKEKRTVEFLPLWNSRVNDSRP